MSGQRRLIQNANAVKNYGNIDQLNEDMKNDPNEKAKEITEACIPCKNEYSGGNLKTVKFKK